MDGRVSQLLRPMDAEGRSSLSSCDWPIETVDHLLKLSVHQPYLLREIVSL
jgi:hypothetical protein